MLAALFARRAVGVPGATKPAIRNRWHTSDSTSIPVLANDSPFNYYGRNVQRVRDIDDRRLSTRIEKHIEDMQGYLRADQTPKNSAMVSELRRYEQVHEFLMKPLFELSDERKIMQEYNVKYEGELSRYTSATYGSLTVLLFAPFCGYIILEALLVWAGALTLWREGVRMAALTGKKPDPVKLALYKDLLHDSTSFNGKPDENLRKVIQHLYGIDVK